MKLKQIATLVSLSLIMACSTAMAADPVAPPADQGHGTVTFKGAIIEAPCSIAADSVDQTVQLGQVSSALLKANGTSPARAFDIKLEGCDTTTVKTVTASFSGIADGDDLALAGGTAAGASIVISDTEGVPYAINNGPGSLSAVMPLQAGITLLHFSAALVASSNPDDIRTGDFTSVATFALNYE